MRELWLRWSAMLVMSAGLVMATGCAGSAEKKAWKHYAEELDPAVGHTKLDHFIHEWGMPHKRITLDEGYACNWHFSKGTRSAGVGYIVSVGQSHAAYDDLTLFFDDKNVLRDWRAECKR